MPATNFACPFHGYIVGRLIEWVSVSILTQSTLESFAFDSCNVILLFQAHIRSPFLPKTNALLSLSHPGRWPLCFCSCSRCWLGPMVFVLTLIHSSRSSYPSSAG